ncbi:MAG TPA: hypothetical protein VII32_02765 [Thermoanaerobaculia bacterium]
MVTERRRIAAFRTSESKLRALIASMDDVILILDRDGMYKEIVPTNPSLLYRPAQETIGRHIADFFPPDETSFFLFAPDAVVLDIGLTDVDGITVYGDIHGRWPRLVAPA